MSIKNILVIIGRPFYRTTVFVVRLLSTCIKKLGNFRFPKIILPRLPKLKFKFPSRKLVHQPVRPKNNNFKFRYPKNIRFPTIKISWFVFPVVLLFVFSFCLYFFYDQILKDLPQLDQIHIPPTMTSKIVDKQGNILYKFYQDENRSWIPLSRIPEHLVWATLAIEDKQFYTHIGFSLTGIVRSLIYNVKNRNNSDGSLRGGSTITQQLVKNVFLSNEKTWKRKIKELVLSVLLERKISKNQILERYFNQVPYGGETYGVQEASQKYFGKNVWELNMTESSFLAGLPAAPGSYSPYSNQDYAVARQKRVVDEMVKAGFISSQKAKEVLGTKIEIVNNIKTIKYPHFVFYVKDYVENNLKIPNISSKGLTIVTTIDSQTQDMAQTIVAEEIKKATNLRISNGAALVVDTQKGEILAMIGSKDYWATDIDGKYNVTTALRQPGSSIKPVNYLLALKNNMTLASIIDDSPITYKIQGQPDYSPKNYNGKFMGKVRLKVALASSLNIPSVKLLDKNGVGNMIDLAEKMGITTWTDRSRYGLSLSLGAGEVKMVDLAQAYSSFSQMGNKIEVSPIVEIKNFLNEVIYTKDIKPDRIYGQELAFLINETLSDDLSRAPVFGTNSKLKIGSHRISVKTGTTNSLKDNWCIGWTDKILVVSWVGNNDGKPMSWVASGISGATPIWNRIMTKMVEGAPTFTWPVPDNIAKYNVCGKTEYFIKGTEGNIECPPPPSPTPTPPTS